MSRLMPISLLLLVACGDNMKNPELPDGGPPVDAAPDPVRAVVVTPSAMFQAGQPGVLSVVDVAAATVRPGVLSAGVIGSDPVIRKFGDELFIVNRADNNIVILNASDFSFAGQVGTGAGSNPQDVAVIDDTLYVTTFGNKGMVSVKRTGNQPPIEIDLSKDDPDDKPNCNSVYRVGNQLYVSCELLDDTQQFLPPRGNGVVYVVDPLPRTIAQTVNLTTKNPFNLLTQLPEHAPNAGDLVIGTIDFATGDGCLERIAVGATASSGGCMKTNAEMGGFAARVDVFAPEFTGPVAPIVVPPTMWMVVSDSTTFTSSVKTWNMMTGEVSASLSMSGEAPLDVAVCPDGKVVVTDAPFGGTGGVRIHDGGQRSALLPVGLNPASTAGLVCY